MTDDYIAGAIGDDADRVLVGKGIQQMIAVLGDQAGRMDNDTIRRMIEIVLGDGISWDGVMQELRRVRKDIEDLTTEVKTLKQEVSTMKAEQSERRETSREIVLMLRVVLIAVIAIAVVYLWQAF